MDRGDRAFTLIELLLVIFLLGFTILASPLSRGYISRTEKKATIEKIVADLRWARLKAIIDNKTYCFKIYTADDIYRLDEDSKIDYIIYCDEDKRVVREGSYASRFTLYQNLIPKPVEGEYYDRIRFMSCGTARNGTIGLKDEEGGLMQIVVSQMGRIRIEKE